MSDLMIRGPLTGGTGTPSPFTAGLSGAQRVQDAHARYYDAVMRGNMFFAATQAGVTTSVALSTTHTGLVLSNPVGSGKHLVINKVAWGWTVIAAAINNMGLSVGYNQTTNVTHTTPATINNCLFTGTNNGGVARADTSSTLPTAPIIYMIPQDTPTATTNPSGNLLDLEGGLILPPGAYLCSYTVTASSAAATWWSFQWEEMPILP